MKNISIFKDVVYFHAEGLTYQAIWKTDLWEMASLDGSKVLEIHDVVAPRDATPGILLTGWWHMQKEANTYSNTAANSMLERGAA